MWDTKSQWTGKWSTRKEKHKTKSGKKPGDWEEIRTAAPSQWSYTAFVLSFYPPGVRSACTPWPKYPVLHSLAGQMLWHGHVLLHLTEGPIALLTFSNPKGPTLDLCGCSSGHFNNWSTYFVKHLLLLSAGDSTVSKKE